MSVRTFHQLFILLFNFPEASNKLREQRGRMLSVVCWTGSLQVLPPELAFIPKRVLTYGLAI